MRHFAITVSLAACVLAANPVYIWAQQTLSLTNGDQLTGELVSIDEGNWTFKYAGQDLELDAADVVGFLAPEPIGIRLADGVILAATVSPSQAGLLLQLPDGTSRVVAPADVAAVGDPGNLDALRPLEIGLFSPLLRFWSSTASVGATIKDGNTKTRDVTAFVEFERQTARDRLRVALQLSRAVNRLEGGDTETTAAKYIGELRADVFTGERSFVYAGTRQSRDQFKDIDLRSYYNIGAGHQFIASEKTDLRLSVAGGVRYETFTSGGSTREAVASLNGSFRHTLGPLVLDVSADVTPALDDPSDFQILSQTGLTATLIGGLGFRFGLLYEFDNTPRPGREKHDAEVTTTLTYTLGR